MHSRTYKTIGCCGAVALTAIALSFGGCSERGSARPPDPGADAAVVDCVQMQRAYVNSVLTADQQTDVAITVGAVVRAGEFPRAMPFCSGERPAGTGAGDSMTSQPR